MMLLARAMLVLALALGAAPVRGQDAEECPNPEGLQLSEEELHEKLRAHQEWVENYGYWDPALPGRAVLCHADLRSANLDGADLSWANLKGASAFNLQGAKLSFADLAGAELFGAFLDGANLSYAELAGANLYRANLADANLSFANLEGASLSHASIANAQLGYAILSHAIYAPASNPPDGHVAGIRGLSSVVIPTPADVIGLVQLRTLLREAGLAQEREATYAIERNKTHHLLFLPVLNELDGRVIKEALRWSEPLKLAEGIFRLVAFEWPVAYGLHPGLALQVLLALIGVFALVYLIPLTRSDSGGIYRVWPEERLEAKSSTAKLAGEAKVERLRPRGRLRKLGRGLQFSLLAAFHIGFRELNVGNWISRLQAREYALQAVGWVRVVAGVQSLLSVYLLAMWALTYFGRPFG